MYDVSALYLYFSNNDITKDFEENVIVTVRVNCFHKPTALILKLQEKWKLILVIRTCQDLTQI